MVKGVEGNKNLEYIRGVMNKKYKKEIEWNVKSVGYNIEMGGEVLDDSNGLRRWKSYFREGDVVGFEDGLNELKEYVLEVKGEVDESKVEDDWEEIERLLMKIKEEVGEGGVWKVWGVEYDMSLGVEI